MSGPVILDPEPPIQRCSGCGAWVWHPDVYGCNTCRILGARHGIRGEVK